MIALATMLYAPARFVLDFFRATDVALPDRRYLGLTPAQWACLATFALGVHLWRLGARAPSSPTPPAPTAPSPSSLAPDAGGRDTVPHE
jgi:phosphatidylglycerol:prolipoprotein diacylglycerol transferase